MDPTNALGAKIEDELNIQWNKTERMDKQKAFGMRASLNKLQRDFQRMSTFYKENVSSLQQPKACWGDAHLRSVSNVYEHTDSERDNKEQAHTVIAMEVSLA